jgi:hypothetical protein
MKQILFTLILISVFSCAAFAQIEIAPQKVIGIINSGLFFDKESGIKSLGEAYLNSKTELENMQKFLENLSLKRQSLKNEIFGAACEAKVIQSKLEELLRLAKEIEFRKDEITNFPKTRSSDLLNTFKIPQALVDFQKRKNYLLIIDETKVNLDNGIIADKENYKNVTSEFVLFYNRNYSQLIPNKTN